MSNEHTPMELPPRLPAGTQVGEWRLVDLRGQGAYGVVYRALRVDQEDAGPVALKLAINPWDQRFAREVQLLSRIRHPSIPRLLGHGLLRHASGATHPYFVMEWVEGTPLYSWAEQHTPSSQQVLRLLAQLARALEALHAANAAHRDVKGDNVLVRHSDGRAVLIDFGSGHFQGATRLTWQSLAPGTPAYLSPQACLFHIRSARARDAYYPPSPADDVFALGVTAYRLVTGEYPPPVKPLEDEAGSWRMVSPDPRPLLERNPRVEPRLRELILRMLSDAPEARGTAAELAEALEAASLAPPPARPSTEAGSLPKRSPPRARVPAWKPALALAAAGLSALLLWSLQPRHVPPVHLSSSTQPASHSDTPDAGTSAVGDSPTAPPPSAPPSSEKKPVAQNPLEPRPGQLRPDGKGRCLIQKQVALNGGCWVEISSMTAEECAGSGYAYTRGRCYAPAFEPPQKSLPTSSPGDDR
jgi:serine/threonine protein kinase